jgi:hypothetical protein
LFVGFSFTQVCVLSAGALAGLGGPGAVAVPPTPSAAGAAAPTQAAAPPTPADAAAAAASAVKAGVRPLSRAPARFEVLRLAFADAAPARLLVAGAHQGTLN